MKIPSSVLRARIEKVEGRLREQNVNGLVIYSTGTALGFNSHTHGYLRYLCDWNSQNSASVLILLLDREPILLVSLPYLYFLARETIWFDDVRFVPSADFGREIVNILKSLVIGKPNIGYIGREETPVTLYETMMQGLKGVEWVEANRMIDELRVVKDNLQIDFHRRAAEICDKMFVTLKQVVKSGKKAYQLQADMEHTAKCEGCEYALTWLTVGPAADRPRFYKDECSRIPQAGDQVIAGLMIVYEGHWGHAVRTGTFGNPARAHEEVFAIALEMEEVALEYLKPGLELGEVQKASDGVLRKYYPNVEELNQSRFRCGHSLGLDYEDPILTDAFPQPDFGRVREKRPGREKTPAIRIEPGMVFELHPNLFVPNVGGAVIGDMVVVTETGNQLLNQFPRELIVW